MPSPRPSPTGRGGNYEYPHHGVRLDALTPTLSHGRGGKDECPHHGMRDLPSAHLAPGVTHQLHLPELAGHCVIHNDFSRSGRAVVR